MKLFKLKFSAMVLLLVNFSGYVYAQNNGKITGSVKDAQTHELISFATVVLTDQNTKANVKGTQTDANGSFVLDNLPAGTFSLRLSFVGYDPVIKDSVALNDGINVLNLGDMQMTMSKNKLLNEVAVTAKRAALQNEDGKKIFSVNQSLVSQGGTAADLLQNVPTLQVDINGNVSLRGSTGVKVLVDGKPSAIAGGDIVQILKAIPASSIESIEVIANPSAKYEAEGQGIINIVLKKNSKAGFNGSVSLAGGTRDNYNGTAALSYQTNRINVYGNYSLRDGNTYSNGFQYMTFLQPTDAAVYSNETFPSTTRNKVQNIKTGVDYSIAPKSVLSVSGTLNLLSTHRDEFLNFSNLDVNHIPVQASTQNNTTNSHGKSYELDLGYSQRFEKPGEELSLNFSHSHNNSRNLQVYKSHQDSLNTSGPKPFSDPEESDVWNNVNSYIIQADYVLPIGKTGQFSAGYRGWFSSGSQNQYAYDLGATGETPIYPFTDFFSYHNQISAVYADYKNQVNNFSYEVGLREEDAHLNATFTGHQLSGQIDSNLVSNPNYELYTTPVHVPSRGLYPSVFLTQKLQNDQQLSFSCTSRVSRPTARSVNSSTDFSDPTNYEYGNPKLTPASVNSFELGYNKTWQRITFTSSLYYTRLSNVIKQIQTAPIDGVTVTTFENLKNSATTGLELIGHFDLVKAWNFTANANVFNRQNDASPQYGVAASSGLSWNTNVTNNISLVKGLSVQIRTDYQAADHVIQDKYRAVFALDAAAKYDFPGKNASLSLNSVDVFNSRKRAFLRSSDALLLDFERRTLASRATLTFTYRLGKSVSAPKQPKQKDDNAGKRIDEAERNK